MPRPIYKTMDSLLSYIKTCYKKAHVVIAKAEAEAEPEAVLPYHCELLFQST